MPPAQPRWAFGQVAGGSSGPASPLQLTDAAQYFGAHITPFSPLGDERAEGVLGLLEECAADRGYFPGVVGRLVAGAVDRSTGPGFLAVGRPSFEPVGGGRIATGGGKTYAATEAARVAAAMRRNVSRQGRRRGLLEAFRVF